MVVVVVCFADVVVDVVVDFVYFCFFMFLFFLLTVDGDDVVDVDSFVDIGVDCVVDVEVVGVCVHVVVIDAVVFG